jgi:hypothetical protein
MCSRSGTQAASAPDDGWVGRPSHCREQEHAGHTGTDLEASVGNVAVGHTIACEVE